MGTYNESLIEAGVMASGEGLIDAAEGAVVTSGGEKLRSGSKLEVRRATDASDFADFSDNEYVQTARRWRKDLGTG